METPPFRIRMRTTAAVFASILAFGLPSPSDASERVALVIGNNDYPAIRDAQGREVREAKLENCVRDATAVRDLLRDKLGFAEGNIVFATDQSRVGIFKSLDAFQKLAAKADIAVIYYAGHGMESLDGRETFLIPVDADLAGAAESEAVLEATGVGLGGILEKFGRATRGAKVVLLDCCRDRPKGRTLVDGAAVRGGGLALLDEHIPADTLILLAAAPNRQASDGLDHGPFTKALLEVLPVGGRSMFDAFFAVSDRVQETTQRQQVPWLKFDGSGAIFRENFLVGRGPEVAKVEVPGNTAEMAKLQAELEAERKRREEVERRAEAERKVREEAMKKQSPPPIVSTPSDSPSMMATLWDKITGAKPTVPPNPPTAAQTPSSLPSQSPAPSNPPAVPMVKTDPAPAPAYPASRGMEGSRAGEVREFGGIEMVWCPAGEFLMGSPTSEKDRGDDERQHRVTLTRGFWLAKTETTQGQWRRAMGSNPSHFRGTDLPVESVSWGDAQDWLEKMNEKHPLPEGWKWELPTEAQWEYACRAGTETVFSFGNMLNGKGANCNGNYAYGMGAKGSYLEKTAKVGSYETNAWGLHDMHGNVWEWCRNWYGDYNSYRHLLGDARNDPTGPASGLVRVFRGGGWSSNAADCRSAHRGRVTPDIRDRYLGFRAAAVPPAR